MNTNSNVYTVIYTTLVVVVVAAVLAFVSSKLGPAQQANAKAETLRQMMVAAQVGTTEELYQSKNDQVLQLYADNIQEAFAIDLDGDKVKDLNIEKSNIELIDNLKPQNKAVKAEGEATLPVYIFKSGKTVVPIYGAGLWGPIWGYIAFEKDHQSIAGAYFDHESETPGLGAKIKDEPWFREKFIGKKAAFGNDPIFKILKNAEEDGSENAVDAITGATMTSKGLNEAVNVWLGAYQPYFKKRMVNAPKSDCCCGNHAEGQCPGEENCTMHSCKGEGQCNGNCEAHKCKGDCDKHAASQQASCGNCNTLPEENAACNGSCKDCQGKGGCKHNK